MVIAQARQEEIDKQWTYDGDMTWEWSDGSWRRAAGWYTRFPAGTRGKSPGSGKTRANDKRKQRRLKKAQYDEEA